MKCGYRLYKREAAVAQVSPRPATERSVVESSSSWGKKICRSVLEQEPNLTLIAPIEQVGTLHGYLCQQCMNVCVNG